MKKQLVILEKSVLAALLLCCLFTLLGFGRSCEEISSRVIRLHILANSDSEEDQALKLKVRNRLLAEASSLLGETTDKQQAAQQLTQILPDLTRAAQDEIRLQGYDYPVRLEITNMYFSTREYENITLPAGHYDALRVLIGEGAGHNWWCVIFPPMCLSAAQGEETAEEAVRAGAQLDAVLPPEELEIVENASEYQVQFKLVEWFEQAREWLLSL